MIFILITDFSKAQSYQSADTIKAPADLQNIYSRQLYSDSLVSSFIIFIKKPAGRQGSKTAQTRFSQRTCDSFGG